jgi:hypothetical protein
MTEKLVNLLCERTKIYYAPVMIVTYKLIMMLVAETCKLTMVLCCYDCDLALQETRTRSSIITKEHSSITEEYTYIPRLSNETTEEYNVDEYMTLYSSVPWNIRGYV